MKIQALQSLRGDYGRLHRGEFAEVSDALGESLIKRGLAKAADGDDANATSAAEASETKEPAKASGRREAKD